MKRTLIIICVFVLCNSFTFKKNDLNNKSNLVCNYTICNRKVEFSFMDSSKISLKRHSFGNKSYVEYFNRKIYLNQNFKARVIGNIDSIIKENTVFPSRPCEYLPIGHFLFVIDETGNVLLKGVNSSCNNYDDYQLEFIRLVKKNNFKFIAAEINHKPVASILFIDFNYYKLMNK